MGGNKIKVAQVPGIGVGNSQLLFGVSEGLDNCKSDQGQQEVWANCGGQQNCTIFPQHMGHSVHVRLLGHCPTHILVKIAFCEIPFQDGIPFLLPHLSAYG